MVIQVIPKQLKPESFHFAELMKYSYERDEKKKEELKGPLLEDIAPYYMKKLDAHVKDNNGFLANGKVGFFIYVQSKYVTQLFFSNNN